MQLIQPVFLATFLEVIWWMLIVFFWITFIAMFIGTFADIFRRDDMSGLSKVLWIVLILFLPILGILIYLIFRPRVTPSDIRMAEQTRRMYGASAADDIAKAQQLLQSGAIDQGQFEELKRRALA
jgi:hypothetical protein